MSVILSIESTGTCQKEVKVSVPAPAVEAEAQRVAAAYRKKVKLPGFRKGKVPAELLKKRFGEEIQQEVLDRLVPRYWKQAEAEGSLEPLLPPTLGAVEHQEGEDLTFVATVDLAPEFELRNVEDFDLPEPPVEPGEDEITTTLEDLRRNAAEWVQVDRPAAQGDLVRAELVELAESLLVLPDGSNAGGEIEEPQKIAFEIGQPQVWEELGLAATGKSAGQSAEFERRIEGEDTPTKKRYRVQVLTVEERDLPPLDDEFAGKIGKFDSLAELRGHVEKRLRHTKQHERRGERERALLDQLVGRHPLEISERVAHHEIEQMLGDYATDLSLQGVEVEKAEVDWQKLGEQIRPQAERRVKARLILDRIAVERGFAVTGEELEAALSAIGRRDGKSAQAVRHALDRAGRLAALNQQLLRDKVVRDLIGEASETEEDVVNETKDVAGPGAAATTEE